MELDHLSLFVSLCLAAPPSECPMHRASATEQPKSAPDVPAHQDRAYEFVQCPVTGSKHAASDINPANMVR